MDRNNKLLKLLFIIVTITTLVNCLGKEENESILDLQNYSPNLQEVVGKYYFKPIKNEFRDDYKYFNLKEGDTLYLEIKKDSSYHFNKFYYNQGKRIDELTGKLKLQDSKLSIIPNIESNERKLYIMGFKNSKETGLYFFNAINSPTDSSDYEYYLIYKKFKSTKF